MPRRAGKCPAEHAVTRIQEQALDLGPFHARLPVRRHRSEASPRLRLWRVIVRCQRRILPSDPDECGDAFVILLFIETEEVGEAGNADVAVDAAEHDLAIEDITLTSGADGPGGKVTL